MARRDWSRARKFSGKEEKYEAGTVLDNGRLVYDRPRDSLAARALEAEKAWLKELHNGTKCRT